MAMRKYACICCREPVRYPAHPGLCRCGSTMIDIDYEIPWETHCAANDERDPAAIVKMWHLGAAPDAYPYEIIEELLQKNRQSLLLQAYGVDLEAA